MVNLIQPNKYIPTAIQLLTPFFIWMGIQSTDNWIWWIVALVFFLCYRMIGHGVGLHRYYCHNQFTTTKLGEWIIGWFSLMSCVGSPSSYTMVHLVHHKYSDTDRDPHGPTKGIKSLFYGFWKPPMDLSNTPVFTRRLSQLIPYMWIHNWYWPLILANAFVLYLIDYKVFLFVWLIPMSMTIWEIAYSTYFSHWTPSENRALNHKNIIGYLCPFHEYLHKTHHDYPMLGDHALNKGEVDFTYKLCKLFATSWKQEHLRDRIL